MRRLSNFKLIMRLITEFIAREYIDELRSNIIELKGENKLLKEQLEVINKKHHKCNCSGNCYRPLVLKKL
jgi:hypothetical protein